MKSLTKFCLIVASVFVVLGIVGVAAGVSLGARPSQFLRMVHYNHHWDFWNDWDLADDIEDLHDDWYDDFDDWKNDMNEWGDLETIDDIEIASVENVDIQEGSFGGDHIEKLKLDLDRSSVKIYTHNEESFRITAKNAKDYFKIKEDGDTLLLEDHRGTRRKNSLILEIYVPERTLEKIELDLGATEFYAESLQAEKLDLDLGAGQSQIEKIEAQKVELEIGAGELLLRNLNASEKAFLGVGTGLLEVNSFAGGDLELDCGVGSLDICVQGKETDYNYTLSCGIGSITLNNDDYSGLGREKIINNDAKKEISMECGIGNITLKCVE